MIGLPINDHECLDAITKVMIELVEQPDQDLIDRAATHETTEALAEWIRALPQRDDNGDPDDGPRVHACKPTQRLDFKSGAPNCLERAAWYIVEAELIDSRPVRQLATLDTKFGLHTFPVENGAPIILDPRVPRNGLGGGIRWRRQPTAIEARDAIDWTHELAEAAAGSTRNGWSRMARARNAIQRLVDHGDPIAEPETIDSVGHFFAMAERTAREYGPRMLEIVRTTALAVADVAEQALHHRARNLALDLGGLRIDVPPWLAQVAGRVGVDAGAVLLRSQLGGLGSEFLGLLEHELNAEGYSLGPLAKKGQAGTSGTTDTHGH